VVDMFSCSVRLRFSCPNQHRRRQLLEMVNAVVCFILGPNAGELCNARVRATWPTPSPSPHQDDDLLGGRIDGYEALSSIHVDLRYELLGFWSAGRGRLYFGGGCASKKLLVLSHLVPTTNQPTKKVWRLR